MELTPYAAWLNEVFALFDSFLLGLHHELAIAYGEILTPIANALGAGGHYGIMFLALAVFLLCFRKTRMAGVAIIVSIAISGALSEFFIKDFVNRPRPFMMSDTFNSWWQFVGSPDAHSSSFPSGHVAAATAAFISLAYAARRWWVSLLGVLLVIAMAMDRMYLMVHYPSDVIAGFILGFICGIIGYAITQGIFRLMGKHPDQIAYARAGASMQDRQVPIPRGPESGYATEGAYGGVQPSANTAPAAPTATQSARQSYHQPMERPGRRGVNHMQNISAAQRTSALQVPPAPQASAYPQQVPARQTPQASQAPQAGQASPAARSSQSPQFAQADRTTQARQASPAVQTARTAQMNQIPQVPQVPQVSSAAQTRQVPQVPQANPTAQARQVPRIPQVPQASPAAQTRQNPPVPQAEPTAQVNQPAQAQEPKHSQQSIAKDSNRSHRPSTAAYKPRHGAAPDQEAEAFPASTPSWMKDPDENREQNMDPLTDIN